MDVDETLKMYDSSNDHDVDEEEPTVDYNEDNTVGELSVDVRDLSANVRSKIDDIIRNNEDLQSQMDAVDALLYGNTECAIQMYTYLLGHYSALVVYKILELFKY